MRLDLRTVKDIPGKSMDFAYEISGLNCGGFEQTPFRVSGSVKNMSGILTLEGKMEGVLSLTCDRCGADFQREKTFRLSGILSDSHDLDMGDGMFPFDGGGVELDDIFIPEFLLDFDMKILCAEDCTGGGLEKYLYVEKDE